MKTKESLGRKIVTTRSVVGAIRKELAAMRREVSGLLSAVHRQEKTWTVNADHDIRVASWHVADLLLGPDDSSIERDDIECQIQSVIKRSFTETAERDPVFGPVDPDTPPPGFRPARRRRHES